jgi:hypothetical protein
MRMQMTTCFAVLTVAGVWGCTKPSTPAADSGAKRMPDSGADAGHLDAGRAGCKPYGIWLLDLGEPVTCGPETNTIHVSPAEDTGNDEIVFRAGGPEAGNCGAAPYQPTVAISSDGCTVTAESHASWCNFSEQQCKVFQLVLHVHGDEADVDGTFRRCWCGTPGFEGMTIALAGTASRTAD